ncbi:MAG: CHASE2 domain-containing protein [Leptolyngbya sp. SIO4C1]|nr:CHASE2 domain-containing protein [Leptolyngbya sp. SIO4C1]
MQLLHKRLSQSGWQALAVSAIASVAMAAVNATGVLQYLEWLILDSYFLLRPAEASEQRVLLVTIDEADLSYVGTWPIPDRVLAEAINQIDQHQPRAIGLDLYRNLPVEPGHEKLVQVFENTPALIGVEKVINRSVAAPPTLEQLDQVGMADFVLDRDGRVRRGLLSAVVADRLRYGLALKLALMYLEADGIYPEAAGGSADAPKLRLGQAVFERFEQHSGGYVGADTGGYQILINYRKPAVSFQTVSFRAVLQNQIPAKLIQGRVVLIGSIAASTNDFFHTSLSRSDQQPGVFIHAHIVSQLLSAALDGRRLIRTAPEPLEWLWIFCWSGISTSVVHWLLQRQAQKLQLKTLTLLIETLTLSSALVGASFGLFIWGWWMPVMAALLALLASNVAMLVVYSQQLQGLATLDSLTQLANRRYFDQYLAQMMQQKQALSLILCDVDYFKSYNDTYGHPAGDKCLYEVAQAIRQTLQRSNLAARYGGEEFAIVLPDTRSEAALETVYRIQQRIEQLQIPHVGSQVSSQITLSYGIASLSKHQGLSASELIKQADEALYCSKQAGRNQVMVAPAG